MAEGWLKKFKKKMKTCEILPRSAMVCWPLSSRHAVLPPETKPILQRFTSTQPATGGHWHGAYDYYADNSTKAAHPSRQCVGYLCRVGKQWNIYMDLKEPEASEKFLQMMEVCLENHPLVEAIEQMKEKDKEHRNVAFYTKNNFSGMAGYPPSKLAAGCRRTVSRIGRGFPEPYQGRSG